MNDIDNDLDKERERYLISIADAYGLMPFSSEFSNFLNAKGKKKFKVGSLKKGLKKLGGQIKSGVKAVGKGVAKVVGAVPTGLAQTPPLDVPPLGLVIGPH